jgi:hypothetical protein
VGSANGAPHGHSAGREEGARSRISAPTEILETI